jgi:bifunctional DNA-binding transcriptional regulator/antitoxin component of YhaV-PrlF toxin-antitoxin module
MAVDTLERGMENMLKEKVTLRKRGQFTVPKNFMDELNLHDGDSFEARIEDGFGPISTNPSLPTMVLV